MATALGRDRREVFKSWNGKRAVSTAASSIPDDWGTAVNVQHGLRKQATPRPRRGLHAIRPPERTSSGRMAGQRPGRGHASPCTTLERRDQEQSNRHLTSARNRVAGVHAGSWLRFATSSSTIKDMQDVEVHDPGGQALHAPVPQRQADGRGRLNMAMEMLDEGLIDEQTAVTRVPGLLDELLPRLWTTAEERELFAKVCPPAPAAPTGQVVFTSDDGGRSQGRQVHPRPRRDQPRGRRGMRAPKAFYGRRHDGRRQFARGWGKCCIVGAGELKINISAGTMTAGGMTLKAGDVIAQRDPRTGLQGPVRRWTSENPRFQEFMKLVDKFRTMGVRTNADTPQDAKIAREFGAEGIGLTRTGAHVLWGRIGRCPVHPAEDDPRRQRRKNATRRSTSWPRSSSVTSRLRSGDGQAAGHRPAVTRRSTSSSPTKRACSRAGLACCTAPSREIQAARPWARRLNPMMGHRGVRLRHHPHAPDEVQIRAILEAATELKKAGKN